MVANACSSRAIRFAIIVDEERLAGWQLNCIEALQELEGVHAVLLIIREPIALPSRRSSLLWRLYDRLVLDRASALGRPQGLPQSIASLPVLRLGPDVLSSASGKIRDLDPNLDFVLDFGSGQRANECIDVARHGIWSFHFGDPAGPQSLPAGFWEIFREEPVTAAALVRLGNGPGSGTILRSGHFKTNAAFYVRSRDQLFREAATWPARICRNLEDGTATSSSGGQPASASVQLQLPSNGQMARFLALLVRGFLKKLGRRLFRQQIWQVGIVDVPVHEFVGLEGRSKKAPPVRWLPNPKGRFLADPFAVELGGGEMLLLAEDYDWSTARGDISALSIGSGPSGEPSRVFDLPWHLSYPFLLEHEGRLYCIPETHEAGEVGLYVLDEQSRKWSKDCVLISGRRLADSTLVEWNGQWWLFAIDVDDEQVRNLHAWLAPDLHGPWREHPANPLKIDIRSSRPAGRPFIWQGSLYRPAQDCSKVYGGGVAINKVHQMTPTRYEEEVVGLIYPDKQWAASDGLHHVCGVGNRTIIDACQEAFIWRASAATLFGKFSKLRFSRRNGATSNGGTDQD